MSSVSAKIIGASNKQKSEKAIASSAPAHASRFPICLMIDASRSTAEPWKGNPPDIDIINRSLTEILKTFREAPRDTSLGRYKNVIDLAIFAYNTEVTPILGWTCAENLPPQIPTLVGQNGTWTGLAITEVVARIGEYQLKQRAAKTKVCVANIIHITDGAPTDMEPGDQTWLKLQSEFEGAAGNAKTGKKQAISIVHFLTPNGCDPTFPPNVAGTTNGITQGLDRLAKLTGSESVKPMNKGMKDMNNLVKLITGTVVGSVRGKDIKSAAADSLKALDNTTIGKSSGSEIGVP